MRRSKPYIEGFHDPEEKPMQMQDEEARDSASPWSEPLSREPQLFHAMLGAKSVEELADTLRLIADDLDAYARRGMELWTKGVVIGGITAEEVLYEWEGGPREWMLEKGEVRDGTGTT